MFDRKQSLSWLIVLSIVTGGVGQALMLGAAPHERPARAVPRVIARHLAASFRPLLPTHLLRKPHVPTVEL